MGKPTLAPTTSADLLAGPRPKELMLLAGKDGVGKAQPLDANILTPTGWRPMGSLKVGDALINPSGGTTAVAGIFPQGMLNIYRVTFRDGSSTECSLDHLWLVRGYNRVQGSWRTRVLSLQEILRRGLTKGSGSRKWYIPLVAPVDFAPQDVPLDPYLIGLLLGDGHLPRGRSGITFSTADKELLLRLKDTLPAGVALRQNSRYDWRLSGSPAPGKPNPLHQAIRSLGLSGCSSHDKFVPDVYKYNTVEVRLAVLQGLLDTDGHANSRTTTIEYTSTSRRLADDVVELARTLGGTATLHEKATTWSYLGVRKHGHAYRVLLSMPANSSPFRLTRKAAAWRRPTKYMPTRPLVSVDFVGQKLAQCIAVATAQQSYVTDDYIVTHNTSAVVSLAAWVSQIAPDARFFVLDTENKFPNVYRAWGDEAPKNVLYYKTSDMDAVIAAFDQVLENHRPGDWLAVESMARAWEYAQSLGYEAVTGLTKPQYLEKRRQVVGKMPTPTPHPDELWNVTKNAHDTAFLDKMCATDDLNIIMTTILKKPPREGGRATENKTRKEMREEFGIDVGLGGAPSLPFYVSTLCLFEREKGVVSCRVLRDDPSGKSNYEFPTTDWQSWGMDFWSACR